MTELSPVTEEQVRFCEENGFVRLDGPLFPVIAREAP